MNITETDENGDDYPNEKCKNTLYPKLFQRKGIWLHRIRSPSSPSKPKQYPSCYTKPKPAYYECTWRVTAPIGNQIKLDMLIYSFAWSYKTCIVRCTSNYWYDSLAIYEGKPPFQNWNLRRSLQRYGQQEEIILDGNGLLMQLKVYNDFNDRGCYGVPEGFRLKFEIAGKKIIK